MPNNDLPSIQVIIYHFLITKFGETYNYIPEMHQSSLIYLHTQLKLNIMERIELYEIFDEMKEIIGSNELLEALIRAMSTQEIEENLRYIDRCYDLDLFQKKEIKFPY